MADYCQFCCKKIRPFGKFDWNTREYHKTCWKKKQELGKEEAIQYALSNLDKDDYELVK